MAFGPRGFLIEAPELPESACYGLFDVVTPRTITDPHWMSSGVEWEDFLCSPSVSGFVGECPPSSFTKEVEDDGGNFCHADPFVVYGSYGCSTGGRPAEESFKIAEDRLHAWEQWSVERILWTGQSLNGQVNPSFAFGNDECDIVPETLSTGVLSAAAALAVLEDYLSDLVPCGGIIHAPNGMASFLSADGLIHKIGDRFYTTTGVPVIFGAGYTGSGPGNVDAAAGTTWMYATGPMVAVRSEVMRVPNDPAQAINRNINRIETRAERFYSVGFSCGLGAVNVKLSCGCDC